MAKRPSPTVRSRRTDRPATSGVPTDRTARRRLARLFQRNGYVRLPNEERLLEGARKYKKGWEVRLVLKTRQELLEVQELLDRVGLKGGRSFVKGRQLVQPIYGQKSVQSFLRRLPRKA